MTIFVSHSTSYNFQDELYLLLRKSDLNNLYKFILPHETTNMPYDTKKFFSLGKCDLVIAECSRPSTGQGIEIGWADVYTIPILCIYKKGKLASEALKMLTDYFFEYKNSDEMIAKLSNFLKNHKSNIKIKT